MNIASVAFTVENFHFLRFINNKFCIELIIERYVEDVFNWKCNSHFVIGGIAVALASIIADKVGGKLRGGTSYYAACYFCGYYRISFRSSWYAISGDVGGSLVLEQLSVFCLVY